MAVESNTTIDPGAMEAPATFVNRAQIVAAGPNMRLAFAEGFTGSNYTYRTAVVLNLQDAWDLAQAILASLANAGFEPLAQQAPASPTKRERAGG